MGELGVSSARLALVLLLRASLASLPPGQAAALSYPGSGGGRAAPPSSSGGGKLTLGSRLGSLTQIRHDKEGESGTSAEAQAWAEPSSGGCR